MPQPPDGSAPSEERALAAADGAPDAAARGDVGSSDARPPWRATFGAVLLFALVTGALHFRVTDPYRIYCEDLEHSFLARAAYTYQHPWEAFAGAPTPSCNFGTANYLTDGDPAAVFPPLAVALSRIAPRDPGGLARFEWRITSLYLLASMTALFLFLRQVGASPALAAAVACAYPFAFTIFHEWRHADLMRGRLMIAPVLLGLVVATRRGGYRGWLLLALAVIACMAQATQLYWVAALVAYWVAAGAWIERRRIHDLLRRQGRRAVRHAGPPLLALAVVAAALGPIYVRGQAAMTDSAFYDELTRDPERVLYYFHDGRDWFSLGELATLERGFLPWSLAGLCLLGGAAAWRWTRRRRSGDPPVAATTRGEPRALHHPRSIVALALPLFAVSLLLAFVPDLPFGLFVVRDGRLELSFAPIAAPVALAVLFHTTVRTWLVLAEVAALVAGAAAIVAWDRDVQQAPGRNRSGELLTGLALFAGLSAVASLVSAEPWPAPAHGRALAAAGAVFGALLLASARGRTRSIGRAALVALGVLFAVHLSRAHYRAGIGRCSLGAADAVALLARDETLLARMPEAVRSQREHRLFGEKWCYYLDAPCALSYGLRTLPRDVLRFFEAAGAVEDVRLPYWLYLDYALLIENGIAQMLGIRWWILPADVMDGGVLLTDERDPGPLRLHEARGVFSKGWALESWETAESFDHAVTRVMALGRAGELRRRGVVQTPEEGPLELPAAAGAAGGADPTVELLGVEPGRLRFRVESESPTVLATNEFFHPDWTARAEGRSLPIVRVNAAFVGAVVPGGVNEVELAR